MPRHLVKFSGWVIVEADDQIKAGSEFSGSVGDVINQAFESEGLVGDWSAEYFATLPDEFIDKE